MAKKLLLIQSTSNILTLNIQRPLHQKGDSMTFEQWAAEMKNGLSFQRDENVRDLARHGSISSWNDDTFGAEIDEDESASNPSQDS